MATGERPFKGDTNVSVLSAILTDTPSSVTDLRQDLPRDAGRILKRCLAEDPLALFGGDGQPLYGRLATNRPHQFKAQFVYTAPFGLNLGVFQSLASGLPVSRFAVLSLDIAPVFYAGRRSEGRTPPLSQTDLSVQYGLALGGHKRLTVGLNVLNLFNQAQGVSRYSLENDQGVQGVIDQADYYAGRADVGAAIDEQQVPRDPRFLQYEFFQEPIRARVMVRFSF